MPHAFKATTVHVVARLVLFAWLCSGQVYAQASDEGSDTEDDDQVTELASMEIIGHFNSRRILGFTGSAHVISSDDIEAQQTTTLLPTLNRVPGLRMEQRSPGSYRLAMRGSLIRSPFGIRNVKIYLDEFSLTDAGGNTYLNLMDPASIASIHVLKGPDGSLYGANSGGVIRLQPKGFDVLQNRGSVLLSGGSYGLKQEQLSVQRRVNDEYGFSFDQSFFQSDGYRDHSVLDRKTYQTAHQWRYSDSNELRFLAFYSDLHYETPGGLTESQRRENPRQSRPATAFTPSAEEQQAGIYNETLFAGVVHEARINDRLTHSISLFGSDTDFENPFITNYEFRTEKNAGLRTYFSYQDSLSADIDWEMQWGLEAQKGWNNIINYDNAQGRPGALQARDELDNSRAGLFYRGMLNIDNRWTVEGSLGLNYAAIDYVSDDDQTSEIAGRISFGRIWMPRLATAYLLTDNVAVRASVSKGYSPPTLAEVRSSDNIINTELEPESGINYEVGLRWENPGRRFMADISAYHYTMDNGIVRQLRADGAEYFVNAGEIEQQGIEAALESYLITPQSDGFIQSLSMQSGLAYQHYRFGQYQVDGNDYSGNPVTAVPEWVLSNTLSFDFKHNLGLNISHYYTDRIPLNDANTMFSEAYHLLQIKARWQHRLSSTLQMDVFAGINNALNKDYSLGNDINAFGNRYFNPAPKRNYYAGVKVLF